ncbi:hypothetical protein F0365_12550 [Nonlabens sp. Ci31]|uniref:hypothetical protein n=1 Tax=Nonlabens sp. Ci31 TaxID=2608253 RepID=UPI001462BF06|nr:hypothetical protein [Nonlabens sp. Ci31]QJP35159.1 hypothetical protein F0365_12550 [Nonlabens sp. Ci31]
MFTSETLAPAGEFGTAARTYKNAVNIKVSNPQALIVGWKKWRGIPYKPIEGDFHNSHNRVDDWTNNTPDE